MADYLVSPPLKKTTASPYPSSTKLPQRTPSSSFKRNMPLFSLPNELLIIIAKFLPSAKDINSFLLTNHLLSTVLAQTLHDFIFEAGIQDKLLLWAARAGDESLARFLLEKGVSTSVRGEEELDIGIREYRYNWTPLHYAAKFKHDDIARLLIEKGANVNDVAGRIPYAVTPLHVAAATQREAMIKLLLSNGADVSLSPDSTPTVLELSVCAWGFINPVETPGAVRLLLDNGAIIRDNLLPRAVLLGHQLVVKLLLERGAKVNPEALHFAISTQQEEMLKILLQPEAYVNKMAPDGTTALHKAVGIESYLKKEGTMVKLLLQNGANVNALTSAGMTALHHAASLGSEAIVRILLESGADVAIKTKMERTSIHIAVSGGHIAIIGLLLEGKGADAAIAAQARGTTGATALHQAASTGQEEIVNRLLSKGANIAALDHKGWTPLHRAALAGDEGVTRLLLDKGADVAKDDGNGITALHQAAFGGSVVVVRLLLERGADITAKDCCGRTALHQAAVNGHLAVVELLLQMGADITARDYRKASALQKAAIRGHVAVVDLLVENGADCADKLAWEGALDCYSEPQISANVPAATNVTGNEYLGWPHE